MNALPVPPQLPPAPEFAAQQPTPQQQPGAMPAMFDPLDYWRADAEHRRRQHLADALMQPSPMGGAFQPGWQRGQMLGSAIVDGLGALFAGGSEPPTR